MAQNSLWDSATQTPKGVMEESEFVIERDARIVARRYGLSLEDARAALRSMYPALKKDGLTDAKIAQEVRNMVQGRIATYADVWRGFVLLARHENERKKNQVSRKVFTWFAKRWRT